MPFKVGTSRIGRQRGGSNTIGQSYLGYKSVFGSRKDRKVIDIPESGLVAWFDARDYLDNSTVWEDRSNNYLNLKLNASTTKETFKGNDYVVLDGGKTAVTPYTDLFNGNNNHTVIAIQNTVTSDGYNLDGQIYHRITYAIQDINAGALVSDYTEATYLDGGSGGALYWAVPTIYANDKWYRADETINQPAYVASTCTTYNKPFPGSYKQILDGLQGLDDFNYNTMISYRFSSGLASPEIGYIDSGEGAFWQYPGDSGIICPPQSVDTMNGHIDINDNITGAFGGVGAGTWSFGNTTSIRLSGYEDGGSILAQPDSAKYAAMIFYNRKISDAELSEIVDYYKPIFDFR